MNTTQSSDPQQDADPLWDPVEGHPNGNCPNLTVILVLSTQQSHVVCPGLTNDSQKLVPSSQKYGRPTYAFDETFVTESHTI